MILFPTTQLEIKPTLTVSEAESVLSEEIGITQLKGYRGKLMNSEFKLGCSRYLKVPVSIMHGQIENQGGSTIIKVSIRPTYFQFIFPLIFIVMAFSRITTDFSQFLQIIMIAIIMIGLLIILYGYSVKKDSEFINSIFKKSE
jgi:Ca2+/Na+ antiporter